MAFQPWQYRTESAFTSDDADLTGFSIVAVDGDIGHVDEVTNEQLGTLVVDTGPWIFGRTVMLPAVWSNGSTPPRRRSTSTGPGPDQERTRVRRTRRRRPVPRPSRRLLHRHVQHSRHPDVTGGTGVTRLSGSI